MRSIIFGKNEQPKSPFRTISWNVLSARVKSTLITNVDVFKNYFPSSEHPRWKKSIRNVKSVYLFFRAPISSVYEV